MHLPTSFSPAIRQAVERQPLRALHAHAVAIAFELSDADRDAVAAQASDVVARFCDLTAYTLLATAVGHRRIERLKRTLAVRAGREYLCDLVAVNGQRATSNSVADWETRDRWYYVTAAASQDEKDGFIEELRAWARLARPGGVVQIKLNSVAAHTLVLERCTRSGQDPWVFVHQAYQGLYPLRSEARSFESVAAVLRAGLDGNLDAGLRELWLPPSVVSKADRDRVADNPDGSTIAELAAFVFDESDPQQWAANHAALASVTVVAPAAGTAPVADDQITPYVGLAAQP